MMTMLDRPAKETAHFHGKSIDEFQRSEDGAAGYRYSRRIEIVVFLVAFASYIALAMWMRAGLHYAIGDSLSRNQSARTVLFGSQPKLSALGFVWPPLPTMAEFPIVAILEPFGHAAFAGPIMSAIFGAATVVVLLRLSQQLGVTPWKGWLAIGLYAVNPVVGFHSATGMSESPYFFFIAVLAVGFSGWILRRRLPDLVVAGVGLLGMVLTRIETIFLIPMVGFAACLMVQGFRQRARVFTLIIMPAVFGQLVWMMAAKLIVSNFLYSIENPGAVVGGPSKGARWMADDRTLMYCIKYAAKLSLIHGVGFVALTAVAIVLALERGRHFAFGLIMVIAGCAFFPAFQALLIFKDRSWGDPRYFSTIVIFTVILALWMMQRPPPHHVPAAKSGLAWSIITVAISALALAANAISGTLGLANPTTAAIEQEWVVFNAIAGRPRPSGEPEPNEIRIDRFTEIAKLIDSKLALNDNELVFVEVRTAFPVMLWTKYPDRFVGDSDDRFEPLTNSGGGTIRYAITSRSAFASPLTAMLNRGGGWRPIADSGAAQLWERVDLNNG